MTKTNLIFFDTETTGNEAKDKLCQLAYKTDGETFCELYDPGTKIPPEASAVHHISNKMIVGKPAFQASESYEKVKSLFEDENSVVVAHNTTFDLMMIKKEDIIPKRFICTLRVARYLDKEEKIDKYNLQYLRYLLDIDVEAQAHDALGDVVVLEELFKRLEAKVAKDLIDGGASEEEAKTKAIDEMIEISSHPSLLHTFKFGKYNGKKIKEVLTYDRGYLEWLLAQKLSGDNALNGADEDWIYTLKYYLESN